MASKSYPTVRVKNSVKRRMVANPLLVIAIGELTGSVTDDVYDVDMEELELS